MIRLVWAMFLGAVFLVNKAESAQTIPLVGDDWQLVSFEPGQGVTNRAFAEGYPFQDALPATVPGDVHWDLERAGKIPPIYYGTNSMQIGWVAGKEWWYRKTFRMPAEWKGKSIRLQFDGVDYLADVWLNGQHLGGHEGQFTPFEYEVAPVMRAGGDNVLTVMIHPAPSVVREAIAAGKGEWVVMQAIRSAYPYWKCMTNAGWDWGAKIITMGIWKDVRLVASEAVSLGNPIVLPELAPPYDRATLNTRLNVKADKPCSVEMTYRVRSLTATTVPVVVTQKMDLAAGQQPVNFALEINQPQLWWPNGYGPQHLYELEVVIHPADEGGVLAVGRAVFGIRDLEMLQNPEADDNKEYLDFATGGPVKLKLPNPPPERKYLMQINGRKIFARGGNWIPCDLLYGRPRRTAYEYLIRMAAEANCNLFRVWGGGLIDKPEFFELCDRYGILLYQEFPNAGAKLLETDAALAVTAKETREIIPRLMNHPCIVRYGGGNEWYRNAQTSRQMAQLRKICNEVDPTRPYHDPDPETVAQRHGPHGYVYPYSYHTYNTGLPLTCGPDNALEWNEYGAAGAASVETLKSIMPAESLWPINKNDPHWVSHKAFNAFGPDNWMGSLQVLTLFGKLPDLETTVRCSQFVQAEGLRYANQSMRRFRWHRSACASWTFNEPWPNAAHGSMVEYLGRPKMAYYYTRQAFAPVDVLAVYSNLEAPVGKPMRVEIWGVNDHLESLAGYRCRYRVTDLHGKVLAEKEIAAEVPGEGNVKIGAVEWTPAAEMAGDVALVWLELLDATGLAVARHLYTFGVPAPRQPLLRSLFDAPKTTLESAIVDRKVKADGETELTVEVRNAGEVPALLVKAEAVRPDALEAGKLPPRLDWIYFSDNYFSLQAGEVRRLRVTLAAHAPRKSAIRIDAWNAGAEEVQGAGS